MQRRHFNKIPRVKLLGPFALCAGLVAGCGDSHNSTPPAPAQGPQTYFAPYVAGVTNLNNGSSVALLGPKSYGIDDTADKFSESTFLLQLPQQQGPQLINVGVTSSAKRGLLSLGIATNYVVTAGTYVPTSYEPPKTGSFALELAGQAGGLVQLIGQPAEPLVAATQCPILKSAQTYQFLTIPAPRIDSSASTGTKPAFTWDPKLETAYGSVDITSDGTNVTFANIHQATLPSVGGTGSPAQQPSSPPTGACGSTVFGNVTAVPGQTAIQNPPGNDPQIPPQALVGIGSSGLLVEDNGALSSGALAGQYENFMGAGTGSVGLPKPSAVVDTNALSSAQYLGFVTGTGAYSQSGTVGRSSHLASFGFSSKPATCSALTPGTATTIYGGDYANDDPSTSPDGFGNCNLAIDLGTQDSANNGLFPNAKVWLGASYAGNITGQTYSFSAVAIVGQLNGKNAIFLLGVDSTQPWAIYLLQSN